MKKKIVINCIGDSVTEGMAMQDHHHADYGGTTYPAQLYTLLCDNGYDTKVINCGHGGETLADIAARLGAVPCMTNTDIVLPANGEWVSLGKISVDGGKISGTKLKFFESYPDGQECCVHFTQMSHDTNPVTLGDTLCEMKCQDKENFIRCIIPYKKEKTIPKDTLLFTNNCRCADVNIIFAGYNDGASLSLERYIRVLKKCGEVNGYKYIVIGAPLPVWNSWSDISGETDAEKYECYKSACLDAFGTHFVNLREDFYNCGMDYALEAGFFADKTQEEISEMREKMRNKITPAAFTCDKKSENNAHLSHEGYYVMAKIIYLRLMLLGYMEK